MSQRARIQPYFTNHSLRLTVVTILSSENVETSQIKAVSSHKSDASIQSYYKKPTLHQFQHMSSALTSFIDRKENAPARASSSSSASQSNRGVMVQSSPVPQREISITTIQSNENVLISNGTNLSSILPSGNFHGHSFNITLNINKWCDEISFIQQTLSCFLLNYIFQSTPSLQIWVQLLLRCLLSSFESWKVYAMQCLFEVWVM